MDSTPPIRIELSLPIKSMVKLEVLDCMGRTKAILMNEAKEAGRHSVDLSGKNLMPGLYVCKLTAADESLATKIFLMK